MPDHYYFHCCKCGYRKLRYRNVKRCPDCGDNLVREEDPLANEVAGRLESLESAVAQLRPILIDLYPDVILEDVVTSPECVVHCVIKYLTCIKENRDNATPAAEVARILIRANYVNGWQPMQAAIEATIAGERKRLTEPTEGSPYD